MRRNEGHGRRRTGARARRPAGRRAFPVPVPDAKKARRASSAARSATAKRAAIASTSAAREKYLEGRTLSDDERAFSFLRRNERERKPRHGGLTEIRGPYYS